MLFGKMIKQLREDQGLLQRQIAAQLDIDTPLYSKLERGERMPKREQIGIIAKLLNSDEKLLRSLWLADKVIRTLQTDKDIDHEVVRIVQKQLEIIQSDDTINL